MIPHSWVMRAFELSSQRDPEVETLLRERVCPRWPYWSPPLTPQRVDQLRRDTWDAAE